MKVAIATLLFYRGPPWTEADHMLWNSLTGATDGLTPTVLNDLANAVLEAEVGPAQTLDSNYTTEKLP